MAQQEEIQCGSYSLKWGETISEMKNSSNLYATTNLDALRSRLHDDGYLLLRNMINSKLIDDALNVVATNLMETWDCIQSNHESNGLNECNQSNDTNNLLIKKGSDGVLLTGYRPITHHEAVQSLLHCDDLITLMYSLFDGEPMTYDTKWVRVKGTNESTDEHSDYYRFADHCTQMVTVWMPLMDIPIEKGPLAICPGSHLLIDSEQNDGENMEFADYKESELPTDFETFHESTVWKTTHFKKGDLLIFDIRTVHASLSNLTRYFRVSIDTRWQPRSAVTMMGDSFVRFPRYLELERELQVNLDNRSVKVNEGDMMMDCTISESEENENENENVDGDSNENDNVEIEMNDNDKFKAMTECSADNDFVVHSQAVNEQTEDPNSRVHSVLV